VKLRCAILIISQLSLGLCLGQTATFIYKNGKVEFGELKKMLADSVYLEKTGAGGVRENIAIPKKMLSEVVFDSGDKLNLSLSEYPPYSTPDAAKPIGTSPAQGRNQDGSAAPPAASMQIAPTVPLSQLRSPFVYGGFSTVVPGLGQFLQGEKGKGAICFGVVGLSVLGAMLAWNSTTTAYDNLERNKSADGSYKDPDFHKFTFRLHGAEILTCVSAMLYLLNIADATADAFAFNRHPSAVKPIISASSTGAGCAVAVTF